MPGVLIEAFKVVCSGLAGVLFLACVVIHVFSDHRGQETSGGPVCAAEDSLVVNEGSREGPVSVVSAS